MVYYGIVIIDPILRFSFIITHNIQRGTYLAFIIAFIESTRCGMWTFFRVENEHCTNIKGQKASRGISLLYLLPEKRLLDSDGTSLALLSICSESRTDAPDTPSMEAGGKYVTTTSNSGAAQTGCSKGRDAPTIEETQEPDGIEEALLDDEGSDGDELEGGLQTEGSAHASSEVEEDESADVERA